MGTDYDTGIKLPLDCEVLHFPAWLSGSEADNLYAILSENYPIKQTNMAMADGSVYQSETGLALFIDPKTVPAESFPAVWGPIIPWPAALARIAQTLSDMFSQRFNLARCVYYDNGNSGVELHTDAPAFGSTQHIVSLSLGAKRDFIFQHQTDQQDKLVVPLSNGSMLYMGMHCQSRYLHGLPRNPQVTLPRINLTFRAFGWD